MSGNEPIGFTDDGLPVFEAGGIGAKLRQAVLKLPMLDSVRPEHIVDALMRTASEALAFREGMKTALGLEGARLDAEIFGAVADLKQANAGLIAAEQRERRTWEETCDELVGDILAVWDALDAVRAALETPDGADVVAHATDVIHRARMDQTPESKAMACIKDLVGVYGSTTVSAWATAAGFEDQPDVRPEATYDDCGKPPVAVSGYGTFVGIRRFSAEREPLWVTHGGLLWGMDGEPRHAWGSQASLPRAERAVLTSHFGVDAAASA